MDRGGDGGRYFGDLANGRGDGADRVHRLARRRLDLGDVAADFLGRAAGLRGEVLDLRRDDREAAAGITRSRRLDGRVQRQQIGLSGDVGDQTADRPILSAPSDSARTTARCARRPRSRRW